MWRALRLWWKTSWLQYLGEVLQPQFAILPQKSGLLILLQYCSSTVATTWLSACCHSLTWYIYHSFLFSCHVLNKLHLFILVLSLLWRTSCTHPLNVMMVCYDSAMQLTFILCISSSCLAEENTSSGSHLNEIVHALFSRAFQLASKIGQKACKRCGYHGWSLLLVATATERTSMSH